MSRFYTPDGQATSCGLKEARDKGYLVSVTTVLTEAWPEDGLKAQQRQIALAAESACRNCWHQEQDEAEWLSTVFDEASRGRGNTEMHPTAKERLRCRTGDNLAIDYWIQWLDDHECLPVKTPRIAISELGFAGEVDAAYSLKDGRIALIGFQDCDPEMDSWHARKWATKLEGVAGALLDSGQAVDCCITVSFDSRNPSQPRIREWPAEERGERWLDFWTCLTMWQRFNRMERTPAINPIKSQKELKSVLTPAGS